MAYYNREALLYSTLQSIARSKHSDVEIIVVDDGSDEEQRVEHLTETFPFLQVVNMDSPKSHINPCLPYNKAIACAKGDVVVIQNPECLHVHDILTHVAENITDNLIVSFSAYAINEDFNQKVGRFAAEKTFPIYFETLPDRVFKNGLGWYNHSIHRPVYYHFCLAMTKRNLDRLGGFDERFADGYCFDDDEFVMRIKRLGIPFIIEDSISVIHQWHEKHKIPNQQALWQKNKKLYQQISKESTIKTTNRYAN